MDTNFSEFIYFNVNNIVIRYFYIIAGTICLVVGLVGIVTPGLPTTPFILLTAFLYGKSSPKLYQRVVDNKVTGAYLNKMNGGLSIKATLCSISLMWLMISFTVFVVFRSNPKMQMTMGILGIIGTIAQIIVLSRKVILKKKRQTEFSEKQVD